MKCRSSGAGASGRAALVALIVSTASTVWSETPQVLWSWSYPPPSSVNDNVETVLGVPDLDGDGYPDALAACQDYRVRVLSGHSSGTATAWTFGGTDERPEEDTALALFPDLTGDGLPEIIYNTAGNDRSVHLIRSDTGAALWSFDLRSTGCTNLAWIYQAVPVGDLDGDGVPDIAAISGATCNRIFALSGHSGALLWQYTANDGCRTVAAAGDLNRDGTPDVLAGCGTNNLDNRFLLLDGRPVPTGSRVIWQHVAGTKMVGAVAMTDDITADKIEDAVGGSWDGTVFAISGASVGSVTTPLWETSLGSSSYWVSRILRIPDLDGDCVDDLAIGSWSPNARVLSGRTGSTIWAQPANASYARTAAIVPDLTGDMQWDVVYGTTGPGHVTLFSGTDGERIWEWAAPPTPSNHNVRSVAYTGDVNDDGLPDIVAGMQNSASVYAFSGRTTGACIRPAAEVADLRASRLDADRISLDWAASADMCHGGYRVFGVPSGVRDESGCFAQLVDITEDDEDGDPSNTSWLGPGEFLGYLVIDQAPGGGKGPLGHFRR